MPDLLAETVAAVRHEHHTDDARVADRTSDADRSAHADGAAPGRHALRDDERETTGTTDPRGNRSPRTEEHTR